MSGATLQLDPQIQGYLRDHSLREPTPCRQLRELAEQRDDANLISSPEQVQLLALVAELMTTRRVIEVGTYVGYTALWLALALRDDAQITCIDSDEDVATIARNAWKDAGVDRRIELFERDAMEVLDGLLEIGRAAQFDLAYIDADKERQIDYYEHCLRLVRPGGLVVVDNTLWSGRVADPDERSESTEAVRRFNSHVHADERIDLSLVPIGDGVTIIRKR